MNLSQKLAIDTKDADLEVMLKSANDQELVKMAAYAFISKASDRNKVKIYRAARNALNRTLRAYKKKVTL
jgi:hypothetical protein